MTHEDDVRHDQPSTGSWPDGPPWWTSAVVYQVYPRSFADSDGDGVGDLAGITAELGQLAELDIDAIWLSPFYPSPQLDGGYDVVVEATGAVEVAQLCVPLARNGGSDRQFGTITMLVYEFGWALRDLGRASATAWLLFLLICVFAGVNYLLIRRFGSLGGAK